jgi:hypothetical protein
MGKPVEGGELLESRELAASACLYAFIGTSAAAAAAEIHVTRDARTRGSFLGDGCLCAMAGRARDPFSRFNLHTFMSRVSIFNLIFLEAAWYAHA